MAAIRIKGKPSLNFKVMVDSGVTWGIVPLLAIVQPLTWAMVQKESGITQFLMDAMQPVIAVSGPATFALLIGLVAVVLTQAMNNGAIGVALMPLALSYCQATGASPDMALMMVVMSIHMGFLTPAASASAALLHGNEWSNAMAVWKSAPIVIFVSWIICAAITVSLGAAIF